MYEQMLSDVRNRLAEIDQISLEQDSFNEEWKELSAMENCLIRLIKIYDRRGNDISSSSH